MTGLIPADMNELRMRRIIISQLLNRKLRSVAHQSREKASKNGGTAARVRRAALYQVEEPGWILKPGFQGKKD